MLRILSRLHEIFGKTRASRGAARLLLLRWIGRRWLQLRAVPRLRRGPPDIGVVVGVRDRCDHRLNNALRSLRDQTYSRGQVHIVLVDYGSGREHARCLAATCSRFEATYVRVDDGGVWSRSHCLNIGIRHCDTRMLLVSDVDMVFSENYLADAVRALEADPLAFVCSTMWDLPPTSVDAARAAGEGADPLPMRQWKAVCTPRRGWELHPSVAMTYTEYFRMLRGYDEYYQVWGYEDRDLVRRFERLGLTAAMPDGGSFYLHQWHPKFEGVADQGTQGQIARNKAHFQDSLTIVRNGPGWGTPG